MFDHLKHIEIEATAPLRHTASVPVASVLFHAGRAQIVAHRTAAEHDLLERGAIHVGMVRFDRAPTPAGIRLRRLSAYDSFSPEPIWGSGRN